MVPASNVARPAEEAGKELKRQYLWSIVSRIVKPQNVTDDGTFQLRPLHLRAEVRPVTLFYGTALRLGMAQPGEGTLRGGTKAPLWRAIENGIMTVEGKDHV